VQSGLPDALVFVDHTLRGRTDGQGVFSVQLEAKSHQVRVEKPGFQTPAEQQIDIASGSSGRLTFKLDPVLPEVKSEKARSREATKSVAPSSQEVPKLPQAPSPGTTLDTEAQDWERASAAADPAQIEEYLKKYSSGSHKSEAESRLQDLVWGQVNRNDTTALQGYLNRFPKGQHSDEASAQIEALLWSKLDKKDRQALQGFLVEYPNSAHRNEAQSILYQLDRQRSEERQDIQAALDKFNAAFERQQPRELKDIWPGATSKYLEQLHPPAGYKVIFTLQPSGYPAISGDTAQVPCDLKTETTEPGGQIKTNRKAVVVRLRKTGNRWLIIDPFAP